MTRLADALRLLVALPVLMAWLALNLALAAYHEATGERRRRRG